MKFSIIPIIAGALILSGCQTTGNSSDKTISKSVAANTKTQLGRWYDMNPDCTLSPLPDVRVIEQPQHGTLAIVKSTDTPRFEASNIRSACNHMRIPVLAAQYTPAAGYTGSDRATVRVIFVNGVEWVRNYAIEVK